MAETCTLSLAINVGGTVLSFVPKVTTSTNTAIITDVDLTANQTNKHILFTFLETDLTAGKLVFVNDNAGGSIVVKTNSSSAPDDTFTIPAGGFYIVESLAADIASIYVTNSDASNTANLYIRGNKTL